MVEPCVDGDTRLWFSLKGEDGDWVDVATPFNEVMATLNEDEGIAI